MLYRDPPAAEPLETSPSPPPSPPPSAPEDAQTIARRHRRRWRIAAVILGLFLLLVGWLAITAPLSRSLEPIAAPGITILAADGTPIARRGAITGKPVSLDELPDHVPQAFMAIEDRRFYDHSGIDPWGIIRAFGKNLVAGGVVEGGSTISQQLAKLAFLSSDRTYGRKLQEMIMAVWLEAWLDKDEILARYMSAAYFGDNVYGIRAAARHYFSKDPADLTVGQAAMLAGLVKAPSRLAPTNDLKAARARGEVVIAAMVDAGFLTEEEAEEIPTVKLKVTKGDDIPTGTYFADWVLPEAQEAAEGAYGEQTIRTTLDTRIQRNAVRAIQRAGLGKAQVALVAMRPTGEVVAMVGGKSYKQSPFNRATQAKRQPGSTFKLFVYLTALRRGLTPESTILDAPITIGDWSPQNSGGVYRGEITLRDAFAWSSNVAAVRLSERVGRDNVIQTARDLGITSELHSNPSLALGTSGVSLIELAAAYAAVANGTYPVKARGLPEEEEEGGWFSSFMNSPNRLGRRVQPMMLDMLWQAANVGTGRAAALNVDTFGKTGTSQDNRDAIFVGFAGDLVTAVWIGNDDNSPLRGIQGGGLPARIWRDFMAASVKGAKPARRATPAPQQEPLPPPTPTEAVPTRITVPLEGTGYEISVDADEESIGVSARPTPGNNRNEERPDRREIPIIDIPPPVPRGEQGTVEDGE